MCTLINHPSGTVLTTRGLPFAARWHEASNGSLAVQVGGWRQGTVWGMMFAGFAFLALVILIGFSFIPAPIAAHPWHVPGIAVALSLVGAVIWSIRYRRVRVEVASDGSAHWKLLTLRGRVVRDWHSSETAIMRRNFLIHIPKRIDPKRAYTLVITDGESALVIAASWKSTDKGLDPDNLPPGILRQHRPGPGYERMCWINSLW